MTQQQIAQAVMKAYDRGQSRDWEMEPMDDVIDKYLPGQGQGTLDKQIMAMEPKLADAMWKEFEKAMKAVEAADIVDEIEDGDGVDFGPGYGVSYVVDRDYSDKYFWITKKESDRFNPDARGNSIHKSQAVKITDPASEVDPDDYNNDDDDDSDESITKAQEILDLLPEGYELDGVEFDVEEEDGEYVFHSDLGTDGKKYRTANDAVHAAQAFIRSNNESVDFKKGDKVWIEQANGDSVSGVVVMVGDKESEVKSDIFGMTHTIPNDKLKKA